MVCFSFQVCALCWYSDNSYEWLSKIQSKLFCKWGFKLQCSNCNAVTCSISWNNTPIFSSPEHEVLGKLLWSVMSVVHCVESTICFKRLLLLALHMVAQLDAPSDWRPGGRGFNPCQVQQHSFMETDHEIFSTVIPSLPLIQEGQLSVSGERMCTILVNRLED